jgi:hypothetical protein
MNCALQYAEWTEGILVTIAQLEHINWLPPGRCPCSKIQPEDGRLFVENPIEKGTVHVHPPWQFRRRLSRLLTGLLPCASLRRTHPAQPRSDARPSVSRDSATLALNTAECVRLDLFAIVCSISSPRRAINGSRSSTYQLVQISGATSDFVNAHWKQRGLVRQDGGGNEDSSASPRMRHQ